MEHLSIGYPDRIVAADVHLEVDHGSRVGVVGDNGQGKTTFLRTVCGSLAPLAGKVNWGYGCEVGVYAQHVYTTLPDNDTVLEYLEHQAAPKTYTQQIKDVAGSLLFSGELIEKKIRVLSGGERARLVLAGLLLKQHNVLVLDEPGNHLDVESVEALADALTRYRGTVIFTSHDRHFMHRVATHVIEVRTGRVASYPASFDDYVYRVQNEIDDGHREASHRRLTWQTNVPPADAAGRGRKSSGRNRIATPKRSSNRSSERSPSSTTKRGPTSAALLSVTDTAEARRLHSQLTDLAAELATLEEQWLELSDELDGG